jgi:hypothetical protein
MQHNAHRNMVSDATPASVASRHCTASSLEGSCTARGGKDLLPEAAGTGAVACVGEKGARLSLNTHCIVWLHCLADHGGGSSAKHCANKRATTDHRTG